MVDLPYVIIGDSLTREWLDLDPGFFERHALRNAGIGGETSARIAARFDADVLAYRPRGVFMMVGTNDVAENEAPTADATILGHVAAMAGKAQASGAFAVICSIPPADAFFWNPAVRPGPRIVTLNRQLRELAQALGVLYADVHGPLQDGKGGLRPEFSRDGVHLTLAGYQAIDPVLSAIIFNDRGSVSR